METVLAYYGFSDFFIDKSGIFDKNHICFVALNEIHFLIFEKNLEVYNLYVAKYNNEKEIGVDIPEIIETVVNNYDKSIPEHRIILRKYLD